MAKATISIVGLGRTGSSIGLALAKPELDFRVIGHDRDAKIAKEAQSIGAVGSAPWNLIDACAPADAVVLAIPLDQVRETLRAVGHELQPGCVVIDTSPVKQPVMGWAAEYLAEGVHFVGVSLGINPKAIYDTATGPAGARADLFADTPCCLMPSPTCRPEAVKLAQDLALLLGATPHFLDPAEYDGLSTVVNLMPALLAAALLGPAVDSPSWREMRRLASSELALFSRPLEAGGQALAQSASLNRANVLYWLDQVIGELRAIRRQVEEDQQDVLVARLGEIYDVRERWLADWQRNLWEKKPDVEMPSAGSWFGQLFGFGQRRKPGQSDEK